MKQIYYILIFLLCAASANAQYVRTDNYGVAGGLSLFRGTVQITQGLIAPGAIVGVPPSSTGVANLDASGKIPMALLKDSVARVPYVLTKSGTSYTLTAADNGNILNFTSTTSVALTVPTGLPSGFTCTIIQGNTGKVTFTPSSTTLNNVGSATRTTGPHARGSIVNISTNVYNIAGDLEIP